MNKVKIGLEIHIQLNTASKLFCGCSTKYDKPNSAVCETCLGMPGSKPMVNEEAIIKGLKLALALNCKIQKKTLFSRKTYFYPDLAKNYQITQYENPLAEKGFLKIKNKIIRIRRLQIEEDPASIQHKPNYVLIDYNRSGIPLIELVTEPDFESTEEVIDFINNLTTILNYLDMYNPSEFSLRADVNVNLDNHPRTEIKNITGRKAIEKALNFEIVRQKSLLLSNQEIRQQTMHYDSSTGSTFVSRTKENEEDYGYIFDPDLPIIEIDDKLVNQIKKEMPELPQQKILRFIKEYKLKELDAYTLTIEKATADLFEDLQKIIGKDRLVKWINGPLRKVLNYNRLNFLETGITKEMIIELLDLIKEGKLTERSGEFVLRELVKNPKEPKRIMEKLGFKDISKEELLLKIKETIKENEKAVNDYNNGKKEALKFLIGQVIRKTKGQADAKLVAKLLKEELIK